MVCNGRKEREKGGEKEGRKEEVCNSRKEKEKGV